MRMFHSSAHTRAARTIWLLMAAGVVLLLAGCAPGAAQTGMQTAAQTSQTATATTSGSPTTPTATPAAGSAQTGCPAATQNANWPTAPSVVVTLPQSTPAQVKVGDTLEVALKMNQKWALLSHDDAILRLDTPAGYGDTALQSCVWHFTALANGQAQVEFSAGPLCLKNLRCPAYIHLVDLSIQVSSK